MLAGSTENPAATLPALRDLGLALLEQGDTKEALPLLTRASEVRPQHLATTILVARLNAKAGQPEAADDNAGAGVASQTR
jgi:Tfp pilus assembly protein PilF